MSPRRRRSSALALVSCAALAGGVVLGAPTAAAAEQGGTAAGDGSRQTRLERIEQEKALARARTMQPRTARYLTKARDLMLAGEYGEAEATLLRLNLRRLSAYERALTLRILAYTAYGNADYERAASRLQQALDEKIFTSTDSADVLFQIAQIRSLQERWTDVVSTLETWFAVSPSPGPEAYFNLGLAHFELDDLEAALAPARRAVELADTPRQAHLQLLLTIELGRKNYPGATEAATALLTHHPDVGPAYWLQLSSLYGIQGDVPRALAVLELAHRKGLLHEDRALRRLAQLSQSEGLPLRAAKLLDDGLEQERIERDVKAYELLGNSWILARSFERAVPALSRAAELSSDGDLFVRLAQVMIQNQQWDAATQALHSAVEKGGLDDPSGADLLLGIAYYNSDRLSEARSWFSRARRAQKTRASADAWLEHIDRELEDGRARGTTLG